MLLNIAFVRTDVDPFTPTTTQLNILRSAAAMSDPYAAYGGALLYKLTGEKVEPVLPEPAPSSRQNLMEEVKEIYSITPNPASDFIKIDIEHLRENSSYGFEIINMTGNKVRIGSLTAHTNIDVAEISKGIYFVQIMKDDKSDSIHKIVILK